MFRIVWISILLILVQPGIAQELKDSFKEAIDGIQESGKDNDWQRAGQLSKTPLYSDPEDFLEFVDKYKPKDLSEKIYLNHQLMRYYVSVEADFDKSFEHLISIIRLLEDQENHVLYPVVLGDAYYIAYWIKHVQHDLKKSREYANRLLSHAKSYQLRTQVLTARMGLAELDQHEGKLEKARSDFLQIESEIEHSADSILLNRLYLLMSNLYVDLNDVDSSMVYATMAYRAIPESNIQLKSFSSVHIARGFLENNMTDSAIVWGERALNIADSLDVKKEQKDIHLILAHAYRDASKYKKAYYHLETHLTMEREQGSLMSAANISNLESDLSEERHTLEVEAKNAEVARKNAEIEKRRILTYALGVGLVLAFGLVFLAVRSYRIKRRDAETISMQRDVLEEKNKEITDSITYAQRIQRAILPPKKILDHNLGEYFLLYKPKDIVAGDFYWLNRHEKGYTIAVGDCTGHGVPGAMVSVICINGLNQASKLTNSGSAAELLNQTREIVLAEFGRSSEQVNDGMDIALCTVNGSKLEFSGAQNPLWIVRSKQEYTPFTDLAEGLDEKIYRISTLGKYDLLEIKGDKQPIGRFGIMRPFTSHVMELKRGDRIYLMSDGYADQFGGDGKGKKLKTGNLKKLLLKVQGSPISQQGLRLEHEFESWKGEIEQLDDVCMIGIEI